MNQTQRQTYRDNMQSELNGADASIEELKAKSKGMPESLREEFEQAMTVASRRAGEAKERLAQLDRASADAWDEAQMGLDRAWNELRKAYRRAAEVLQRSS